MNIEIGRERHYYLSDLTRQVKSFVLRFIYHGEDRSKGIIYGVSDYMEIPERYRTVVDEFVDRVVVNICNETYEHGIEAGYIKDLIKGFFLEEVEYERDMAEDSGYRVAYVLSTLISSIVDAFTLVNLSEPVDMFSGVSTHAMAETLAVMIWKEHGVSVECECVVPEKWTTLASSAYVTATPQGVCSDDRVALLLNTSLPVVAKKGFIRLASRKFKDSEVVGDRYVQVKISKTVPKQQEVREVVTNAKYPLELRDDDIQDIVDELDGNIVVLANRSVSVKRAVVRSIYDSDGKKYRDYHLILYHLGSKVSVLSSTCLDMVANARSITIIEPGAKSVGVGGIRSEMRYFVDSLKRYTYDEMILHAPYRNLSPENLSSRLKKEGFLIRTLNIERTTYRGWAIRILNPDDTLELYGSTGRNMAISSGGLMPQLFTLDITWICRMCGIRREDVKKIMVMSDARAYAYLRRLEYLR